MTRASRTWWRPPLGVLCIVVLSACGYGADAPGGTTGAAEETPGVLAVNEAQPLAVTVVNPTGGLVANYRWVLEHDLTYSVRPGVADPATISVSFHRSHMPVVASGSSAAPPQGLDPAERYFISILPDAGYAMGGAQIAAGQTSVTVLVQPTPLPTAQITVKIFQDNAPINSALDEPQETGLAGFTIIVEEAGGRFGQSGGHQMKDAFNNPLGTTYNPDGSVAMKGDSVIRTGADGRATIKNLAPGKYGVRAVPPAGSSWVQTSTIEGTKTQDAWVKANEPPYFQEFGPPNYHVSIGFVKPTKNAQLLNGGTTISGKITNLHMSRPPGPFFSGASLAHTRAWVGLNVGPTGAGQGAWAQPANEDGTFSIPNLPPGSHQLVVWDESLDQIFAFHGVTVRANGTCATPNNSCNLGDVPVFQWFTRLEHTVFEDKNENGFMDPDEKGIPEMNVNLRWRDGTIYQGFPTDTTGFVPFDQVFPFFSWLVAEVDFARLKATGVTVVVDGGGAVNPQDPWSAGGQLTPAPQPDNNNLPYRTERGPVLTQAFQGFIGQTSQFFWGKKQYAPGENGGISGIVFYATTRAENDPRFAAAEPWEPGIPNVTVNLWNKAGTVMLNSVKTDSWDANPPTGCHGPTFTFRGQQKDCFDGLKNWNQVRPGVFDGGYAFTSYYPDGFGSGTAVPLPAGEYIVEVVPPPGYQIVKEEDKNVDFGEGYKPSTMLLPPECVGPMHTVASQYSLFPLTDDDGNPVAPFKAGEQRPLCSRKKVLLQDRQNAAADFFLFTYVPIAGHVVGFVLDDAANEFDPSNPTFGEKFAPPWLPISVRDWTGREIAHTYSDEFGVYNLLVPSTFTADRPAPSGMSPNMLTLCLNSPTRADPTAPNGYLLDPHYNPQYSQFCYTFQFMPGTTTYLDTPVLPQAAFAGPSQNPLDCELRTGTPRIWSVRGALKGPYVSAANGTQTLTINSPNAAAGGIVTVANPAYDGQNAATITRDHGFGQQQGTVRVGGVALTISSWTPGEIVATVPAGVSTGQLSVTRGDNGLSSINAVTVSVGPGQPAAPVRELQPGEKIQQAIDASAPRTLILIPPGTYDELVILWKPVRLQGAGEGTTINALKAPSEKLQAWRARVANLVTTNAVSLLPNQDGGFGGIEPATLFNEEGPGIIVLSRNVGPGQGGFGLVGGQPNAWIDGFTITGGDSAGGIVVNGYARRLQITNNRVMGNHSAFGGGIRIGHATLTREDGDELEYVDAQNDNIAIRWNQVSKNGALDGAGGGISLYTGTTNYRVEGNFICGNYTQGEGGGIGQLGRSQGGRIQANTIIFNESFNQGVTVSGGGIAIVGAPPLAAGGLSPGTGNVWVLGNTILGNSAGAGDGGGLRLTRVNGQDVEEGGRNTAQVINNFIVNNVAALAGGGISLQDAINVNILQNTIANNDSTATAGEAFAPGSPNTSTRQVAGIVSRRHSQALIDVLEDDEPLFSNPRLINSIIRHNRSFYFASDNVNFDPPQYRLVPAPGEPPVHDDLGVIGVSALLNPRDCILTSTTGYHSSNLAVDPSFVSEYSNGARSQTVAIAEPTTALQVPPAFDEGGNWIRVGFGPLTLWDTTTLARMGDYHLNAGSPALGHGRVLGGPQPVESDIDAQPRPTPAGSLPDIGADER